MAEALGPIDSRLKLSCFNPPLEVPFHQVPNTAGKAGTYNVQFNVNMPAGPGTLFVDANNDAVCNIVTNRTIVAGRSQIIAVDSEVPHAVLVEFQHIEQGAPRFVVNLIPGTQSQGVVNIRFQVDYH